MNIWENTVLTDQGKALQAKLLQGQTLKITRVTTGSKKVPIVDLRQQSDVTEGGYDITLQPSKTEGEKTVLPVLLENTGLKESYDLWQVGFFAEDPDEGEILFCISQASQAKHIPSEAESPGYSVTWDFYFNTSNTVPFEIVLNSSGLVNIEAYQEQTEAISEVNKKVDSLNSALSSKFECGSVSITGKSDGWVFIPVTYSYPHKTIPIVVASHSSADVAQIPCTTRYHSTTGFELGLYRLTAQTAFSWIAIEP
ncbi:hypothetical protein [Anaerostipes caccae]|uniref:hypothetical protein n=1 Tax=Anaerostipes caccae TaxID=105841 RepID=UPI00241FD884|nr:hypothetical protein [Anaerostipes caccae]